ncbi:MAG: hypothetical protein L0G25_03195 [Psychrobacter sp.]|nr:hypothetical protein [Psychrobacter sp.]
MQNAKIQTAFINNCLGYSRHDCLQLLSNNRISNIAFGHWLAIPSQQLLLIFRHQRCVAVNSY